MLKLDKSLHYFTVIEPSQNIVLGSRVESTKEATPRVRGGRCKLSFKPPLQSLEFILLHKLKQFLAEIRSFKLCSVHGKLLGTPYICQNDCCKLSCSTLSSFQWNITGSVSSEVCARNWKNPAFPTEVFLKAFSHSLFRPVYTIPAAVQQFCRGSESLGKILS